MLIQRYIETQLKESLIPGRATIVMGARRVGKTTLIKKISKNEKNTILINCDDPDVIEKYSNISLNELKRALGSYDLIVFDEAQRIKNIGIMLKMIVDELPEKKLLVSGSSSLDLANDISEPMTGRKRTFMLFPISFLELWNFENKDDTATNSYLSEVMRFGSYPVTLSYSSNQDKEIYLSELTTDYLYKDILEYQKIRNPEQLRRLLVALALQIGQEVSFTELSRMVGVSEKTIVSYLDLLEKSYVVFRLPAFSRNMRKEIVKSRKIYFYDLGIRNALIKNFNNYDLRKDRGHVWENLLIAERIKKDMYKGYRKNYYFWRTYDQQEIDLIEEYKGKIVGYEFKWQKTSFSKPAVFLNNYPNSEVHLVNKKSFLRFVT